MFHMVKNKEFSIFSVFTAILMSLYNESGSIYIPNIPKLHFVVLSFIVNFESVCLFKFIKDICGCRFW